ncbi:MAG: DUF1572 family protein [Flavobacteriaceae bacterium]
MELHAIFIQSIRFELLKYKQYGEKTFAQLDEQELQWKRNKTDNSIAIIVKHMVGNMLSRFTNFLSEDGEKPWRNRDSEFQEPYTDMKDMMAAWQKGWACVLDALEMISKENFTAVIKIRNEEHTLPGALHRQLAHYACHVGQIILLGKMIKGDDWQSLSIPKGQSEAFNRLKFKN